MAGRWPMMMCSPTGGALKKWMGMGSAAQAYYPLGSPGPRPLPSPFTRGAHNTSGRPVPGTLREWRKECSWMMWFPQCPPVQEAEAPATDQPASGGEYKSMCLPHAPLLTTLSPKADGRICLSQPITSLAPGVSPSVIFFC